LTETLSTSFLECCSEDLSGLTKEIFRKLIRSVVQFYQDSDSPQMIKSQILKLLTRLIRKLRFILRQDPARRPSKESPAAQSITSEAHFEEICISQDFVTALLSDIEVAKQQDEREARTGGGADETQMLYGSFAQDSVEFLMTIIVPASKQVVLKSYKDLLDIKEGHWGELKAWLDPLMKTSMFMHYFNNEIDCLPHDLLQEIHSQTKLSSHRGMDHILVLDRVPQDEELYPKQWLIQQIVNLCEKHHARLLNPLRDIFFAEAEYEAVVITRTEVIPEKIKEEAPVKIEEAKIEE